MSRHRRRPRRRNALWAAASASKDAGLGACQRLPVFHVLSRGTPSECRAQGHAALTPGPVGKEPASCWEHIPADRPRPLSFRGFPSIWAPQGWCRRRVGAQAASAQRMGPADLSRTFRICASGACSMPSSGLRMEGWDSGDREVPPCPCPLDVCRHPARNKLQVGELRRRDWAFPDPGARSLFLSLITLWAHGQASPAALGPEPSLS